MFVRPRATGSSDTAMLIVGAVATVVLIVVLVLLWVRSRSEKRRRTSSVPGGHADAGPSTGRDASAAPKFERVSRAGVVESE
ncbi:MAG: hypothetical protein JWP75_4010 [Frondihabitans sp.]|nr:hypothetical protein [Frondihabitans sp.]